MMSLPQMRSERDDDGTRMVRRLANGMRIPATVVPRPISMRRPLSIRKVISIMYNHTLVSILTAVVYYSGMEAATPVAGPTAAAPAAGPSSVAAYVASRWDATPVVGLPPSSSDAAKGNASKAHGATRNRWDETPATEGPSSRWDAATPQPGKPGQTEPGTASKKRSRWDETPVAGGAVGGGLLLLFHAV